ncbi:ABC transporter substrate-binding protein [Rhodocytophaga aerolata]|uniref:ABC transporter substrate-binding protein n=1 Tax=Rhodocytophaga aerolata TaxID=455078 RepID=A0ABT8R2D4_9BACT|nr:ABC transporter substrate-binding protein [Rhodocytophaga aerolata]MDO1446252.1 ABC transporter substrate-binding protein [Rhodocytophaga aerolata]
MKVSYLYIILFSVVFWSCDNTPKRSTIKSNLPAEAKGNRSYGGVFRLSEAEYIKSLYPPNITDAFSYRVAAQTYEGLFKFNKENLEVINCLAENHQVDASGTIYTIKLKKGIFFQDDACFENGIGREMVASDVKFCFTQLCTQSPTNQNFPIFKDILKGATQYFEASAGGKKPSFEVEGIKVIDDYTLQLTLEKPSSVLLYNLAGPATFIYPKEAFDKYGIDMRIKPVGTGPFRLSDVDENISMVFKRHDKYHGVDEFGNKLPFLEAISIQFIKDKKTELFEFKKGNLDMLYRLPTEFIIEILEETGSNAAGTEYAQYDLQRAPEMLTQFLAFNTQDKIFADVNVRKAFSFAIDRDKILEQVLNGEGFAAGTHGITPPSFKNYDINQIKGYTLDVDSAKYYLAKAGYANGKGFPVVTLQLNSEGDRNTNVAVEIQKQLKDNLNVTVNLNLVPMAQLVDNSISGNYNFNRMAWQADYPSAENFLWIFNGKDVPNSPKSGSFPNIMRYRNNTFDKFYTQALNAKSIEEANRLFLQAEQIIMNDAPIIVLWYDEGYRLIQSYIKNFPNNPMQYRDFSEVYLERAKDSKQEI